MAKRKSKSSEDVEAGYRIPADPTTYNVKVLEVASKMNREALVALADVRLEHQWLLYSRALNYLFDAHYKLAQERGRRLLNTAEWKDVLSSAQVSR